ncbi:MAG: hypothetical protein WB709_04425, partial [Solirubrobacteraceae bacterium]
GWPIVDRPGHVRLQVSAAPADPRHCAGTVRERPTRFGISFEPFASAGQKSNNSFAKWAFIRLSFCVMRSRTTRASIRHASAEEGAVEGL